MRILMVNTYHYLRGGDSAYALGISAALERAGHEVFPFAMQGSANIPAKTSSYFPEELDYPALQQEGGLHNAWRVLSNSLYNRNARQNLARLLDGHEVDIVHLHSIMHHLTASVVLECRKRGLPIVWTLHDAKAACPTTRFLRDGRVCHECANGRFYRAALHRCKRKSLAASTVVALELYLHRFWKIYENADLLISPSKFLRDTLYGAGLRARRFEVLPNYTRVSDFATPSASGEYGLYVGRLSREKGLDVLLQAARLEPGLALRIAGTGEMEEELRMRCHEWGLDQIQFEGFVDRARVRSLLAGARCLILPSVCDENCPISVLEAFAAGRGVLASHRGGLPELVTDGQTGKLVAPGDVAGLAEALTHVLKNPEEWETMGMNARHLAERSFDEDSHITTLSRLYEEVISAHRAS